MNILAERLSSCGIQSDQIIWLQRTRSPEDHLLQYAEIDISLDPFPNGGCTTSCESLWMGVPVITLTGSSYVSRMSTAVLRGASLDDWCADTLDEYVKIAQLKSQQLNYLRSNRFIWRQKVVTSQLGDSSRLFYELESAFSEISEM